MRTILGGTVAGCLLLASCRSNGGRVQILLAPDPTASSATDVAAQVEPIEVATEARDAAGDATALEYVLEWANSHRDRLRERGRENR
jgi:hypothetical protein